MEKLLPVTKEENDEISKELEVVLNKFGVQLVVSPIISKDGRIEAIVQVFKKVIDESKPAEDTSTETDSKAEEGSEGSGEKSA